MEIFRNYPIRNLGKIWVVSRRLWVIGVIQNNFGNSVVMIVRLPLCLAYKTLHNQEQIFIHNMGCTLEKFVSITDRCRRLFSPPKLPPPPSNDSVEASPWCEAEHSPASSISLKDVWRQSLFPHTPSYCLQDKLYSTLVSYCKPAPLPLN